MPNYKYTKNVLTIFDSWKVRKWDMRKVLEEIRSSVPLDQTDVFNRSIFSLKTEWICHNFLYNIGYKRQQTKDADLDCPCDRPEWQYIICGILVWLFVW